MTELRDPKDIMIGGITLAEALKLHPIWFRSHGAEGKQLAAVGADLSNADLRRAKLSNAHLNSC